VFRRQGMENVKVLYLDTCCADRDFFAKICPSLAARTSCYYDARPSAYRFTGNIVVADDLSQVYAIAHHKRRNTRADDTNLYIHTDSQV
jgi:hypothetical protein